MAEDSCPDRETLKHLLLGDLPQPQLDDLRQHVVQCDRCAAVAERISGDDAFAEADPTSDGATGNEAPVAHASACEQGVSLHADTVKDDETIDFLAPPRRPDEIGRLGNYRVLEVLGVGGMGVVFRAEDIKLARQVALKTLRLAGAASRSAKERFLREARATAAIEHDNIVPIYQVGEDHGIPFIAMQFLRGESLLTRLKTEDLLDQRAVLRIAREVASGLAAAHAQKLIHRDIKPDNIWLESGTDRVKIVDFGLVHTASEDVELTHRGMVVGTPRYMSPEQSRGLHVDHRCDLFSLGCVLYQLAVGKAPFDRDSLSATLVAITEEDPEPVEQLCPGLHPQLAGLIMRLLNKDPSQRPQSATEVVQAVRDIERALSAEAAGQHPTVTVARTERPSPKASSRWSKLGVFVSAGVVVALATLAVLWAAGVFVKVETPSGTVLLEIDSTGKPVTVNIDQDRTITIKDPNDGKEIRVTVDRARKQLRLDKQGFQAVVSSFSLDAADGRRVRAKFVPKEPEDLGQEEKPQKEKPLKKTPLEQKSRIAVDARVLTVAKDGSGQFDSVSAALAKTRRGMTIRVLDDSVYDDMLSLSVPDAHADVTLEAIAGATFKATRSGTLITITVPGVHIRGFRFRAGDVSKTVLCTIGYHCAGTVVEDADFAVDPGQLVQAVSVENGLNEPGEPPVIVRNCRFTGMYVGVRLRGVATDYVNAQPCSGVMVVDNRFHSCIQAIDAEGDIRGFLIAGNQIVGARLFGIQLEQLIGQASQVVLANNTFFRSQWPFRVWDDGPRGRNIWVMNNLSLACGDHDWLFFNSGGDRNTPRGPGDVTALVKLWQFAGNYREAHRPTGSDILSKSWIPGDARDVVAPVIDVRSREPAGQDFLRPALDSPLANGAVRDEVLPLPPYVGAAAPDPNQQWDWTKTWQGMDWSKGAKNPGAPELRS